MAKLSKKGQRGKPTARFREESRRIDALNEQMDLAGRLIPDQQHELGKPSYSENARSFDDWLAEVSPSYDWDWPHLKHIRVQLERMSRGEIDRLLISCPPRHGKSEQTTVRYPMWRLENDPSFRVAVGSHSQNLALKFSRKSRRIARGRVVISKDRDSQSEWETPQDGAYRACSVGSPPMGEGFNLLVIDDPIKSRKEADSEVYRDGVWEWYSEDMCSRLEPGGQIILILTRWHEDDLAGRILNSPEADRWACINLPAIAELNDPLGRVLGEPLCELRCTLAELRLKEKLNPSSFAALYQGHPQALEGGIFKLSWFDRFDFVVPAGSRYVRFWDKAGTPGDGCYTCGVLMAQSPDDTFYVVDVVRAQLDDHAREVFIKQTTEKDRQIYGRVLTGVEQEPGSAGKQSARATIKNLIGFDAFYEPATGAKEVRCGPFASQCGAHNVVLIRNQWNWPYIKELCAFPTGAYADQVDASSGAFNKLHEGRQRGTWKAHRC